MFPQPKLKILHLEDNVLDAELIHELLKAGGINFDPVRVDNREDFMHLMGHGDFDLILADRTGPQFDGLNALAEAAEMVPQTPFIFVSGTMDEGLAIDSLKRGATDYVLKQRLSRLVPAVTRALEEIQTRQEKVILEQQFLQAQKMESLGLLTGEIAHDFNNVLTIMQGYLALLDDDELPESKRPIVATIRQAGDRGATLVRQLLTFARKNDAQFKKIDINEWLAEMVKMIGNTLSVTIRVQSYFQENLPPIAADSGQLHQALLNLCVNARDAMFNGGALTIRSSLVDASSVLEHHPAAKSCAHVLISVTDTGCGMDEVTREHIFDPFFTTKDAGKGTGLGLSVVYGVVQSHHGFIEVESALGQGTSFHIYLPAQSQLAEEKKSDIEAPLTLPGGHETILVVEDEEVLRHLLKMFLGAKGYRVLTAKDGIEAVELYQSQPEAISLVLTDLGLPRLNGLQLFLELKKINPDVKTIICTGFIDAATRSQILSSGVQEIVIKPYESTQILNKVRAVLDLVSTS